MLWVVRSILDGGPRARCSSVVRVFANDAMGCRIDPSWWTPGARCSSDKSVCWWCYGSSDRSFTVDPLSCFSFQGVRCSSVVRAFDHAVMAHRIDPSWWTHWAIFCCPHWCNKRCGACYYLCGIVDIKELLLLIGKNNPCGSSFPYPLTYLTTRYTLLLSYILLQKNERKEGNYLFNDTLNTFYLQL